MTELGKRIRQVRLYLGAKQGNPVTLEEFGKRVAKKEGRRKPYTPATVSGWEQGENEPTLSVLRAILAVGEIPEGEVVRFLLGEHEIKSLKPQ